MSVLVSFCISTRKPSIHHLNIWAKVCVHDIHATSSEQVAKWILNYNLPNRAITMILSCIIDISYPLCLSQTCQVIGAEGHGTPCMFDMTVESIVKTTSFTSL